MLPWAGAHIECYSNTLFGCRVPPALMPLRSCNQGL